jgi:hypothetical protein
VLESQVSRARRVIVRSPKVLQSPVTDRFDPPRRGTELRVCGRMYVHSKGSWVLTADFQVYFVPVHYE